MQVIVVKQMYSDIDNVLECKGDADDHVQKIIEKHYEGIKKYEPEGGTYGYFESMAGDFSFTVMGVERLK